MYCFDESNHKLAFEKICTEEKGYITFEDVIGLSGHEQLKRREDETTELCDGDSHVLFEDLVRITKTKENYIIKGDGMRL